MYFLESKATESDRFDFSMLTQNQHDEMLKFSNIEGVRSYVVVLFATYKRAFLLDIRDIKELEDRGKKSVNIKKIEKWDISFIEIKTVPSRKQLLDYDFEFAKDVFK